MANKERAIVEIELDKPRNLRFTLNALAEIEDRLGVPLSKLGEVELGIKAAQIILWAGLIHEDESLTLKQVGDMVDLTNLEYVQQKIGEAFALATGKNSGK
jgi:hypothetical protein